MIRNLKYEEAMRELQFRSVSFGAMAIRLYEIEQLQSAQIGYSVGADGISFTGNQEGDWRDGWLVIGYEDLSGDPIFIDVLQEECPVYSAMHGEGSWNPRLIASSIDGFTMALATVAALAKGRENIVALDANPLPRTESEVAIAEIQANNPGAGMNFWEDWLNQWQ
jgi:hypothetical protein